MLSNNTKTSKMKKALLFNSPCILLIAISLLSSCDVYLTPAILGHNIAYQPKPMVADSLKTKNYVSASYATSSTPDGSINFGMGMLNYNRAYVDKNLNFSYGGFIDYGVAQNNPSSNKDLATFNKGFFNIGLRTNIGYHITSSNGNTDYRLINWENAFSIESGDYVDFRKNGYNTHVNNTDNTGDIYFSKQTNVWTTGLSSEIIWRSRRHAETHHAFRLFIGGTPNVISNFNFNQQNALPYLAHSRLNFSFSYYLQLKRYYMTYEVGQDYSPAVKFTIGHHF